MNHIIASIQLTMSNFFSCIAPRASGSTSQVPERWIGEWFGLSVETKQADLYLGQKI